MAENEAAVPAPKISQDDLAEHIPSIRRYLTRILRPDEIQDGTQSVLQRALENLSRFRGDSSQRVWLLGIARNVGLEIARARKRRPVLLDVGDVPTGDLPAVETPTAEEALDRKEQHSLALAALDGLSLDEKLALLVTYVDDLSGPEAAEILDVSFAAFRQRLSRARHALARRLDELMTAGVPARAEVIVQWNSLLHPEGAEAEPPG